MDEKKRTKVLGGVLVGVLGLAVVGPAVKDSFLKPVRDAQIKYASAQTSLEAEEAREQDLRVARARISAAQDASLPVNVLDAQRLYQEWITDLAQQCQFAALSVTPGAKGGQAEMFQVAGITVSAETDLEHLARFLHLFEQADLIHRISALDIKPTGSQGNPRLEISLTAEGMSVSGASSRGELFARCGLTSALSAEATTVQVDAPQDFPPAAPFLARVESEMVNVTHVDGATWTVERGIEGTKPADHAAGAIVQQFPVVWERRGLQFDEYAAFLDASPFTKPRPVRTYSPKLATLADRTIAPGEAVAVKATAEDVNPDIGETLFALTEAPEGMTIDEATGDIAWQTPENLSPGEYATTVLLKQQNNPDLNVSAAFKVVVRLPNEAPELTAPESAVVVLGREFLLTVAAQDDGEKLTYAVEGNSVPSGLQIEADDGTLTWTPPRSFLPGEYDVQVKVTDDGDPAKSDSKTIKLIVQDDTALLTRLTGIVKRDGELFAWFWNRGTNRDLKLQVGATIEVAEIQADVIGIESRRVLMRDPAGLWTLDVGDNLRDRQLIEPAASATPEETEIPVESERTAASSADSDDAPSGETPANATPVNASPNSYDRDPPADSPPATATSAD